MKTVDRPDSIIDAITSPPPPPPPSRRGVLKLTVLGLAGVAVGAGGSAVLRYLPVNVRTPWQFLTPAEAALVEAIAEQIIPADQDPGARDAGVVFFIDRQLAGPYERHQKDYRQGLASIQATANAIYKKTFETLSWDEQTALLKTLEANKGPAEFWRIQSSSAFFDMICRHTMQGFYGSPRHGGNRNYASYRMLQIEYPRVMGRSSHPKA